MSEWLPIETAPKDGRRVDLWVIDRAGHGYRYPDVRFDWIADDSFGWTDANSHGRLEPDVAPTHWMPLPSPPDAPSGGRAI